MELLPFWSYGVFFKIELPEIIEVYSAHPIKVQRIAAKDKETTLSITEAHSLPSAEGTDQRGLLCLIVDVIPLYSLVKCSGPYCVPALYEEFARIDSAPDPKHNAGAAPFKKEIFVRLLFIFSVSLSILVIC